MTRWIGRGLIAVALVVAAAVATRWVAGLGTPRIHDAASLPRSISACGRDWVKDDLGRQLGIAAIRSRDGVEPVVVDPGLFTAGPPGACTTMAQAGPCHTVIYVRVGTDAYIDYSLQGGP